MTDSERGAVADLTLDEILSSNPIERDKTSKDLNRPESEKQRVRNVPVMCVLYKYIFGQGFTEDQDKD